MKIKISRVSFAVHPDFKELLINLQNDRVRKGKEITHKKVALWKLSKTVSNAIKANKELYNAMVEVDI